MKKTAGVISFIGSIISLVFLIYIFFEAEIYNDEVEGLFLWFGLIILCLCVLYFCYSSKFWTNHIYATESIDEENKNIKKQIERRKSLLKKLNKYKWTKDIFKFSNFVSALALLTSALSIYFQFFNERHTLLYTTLTPDYNEESKHLIIPLLFKNIGNQTEIILNSELQLEVKDSDESFFKRISPLKNEERYIILAPGENRTIDLAGDYGDYFFGTIKIESINSNNIKYSPITALDSLLLRIKVTYLNTNGVISFEEREIGSISFNRDETIKRIDYNPIELKKLDLSNNERHIVSNFITPHGVQISPKIFLSDSTMTKDKLEKLIKQMKEND
ncbi:MAG: hypothetical protein MUC38_13540 [Cyclobacteriaceae bacterium]|jgi:hypothetical protein|nr:hypothetical protein [Cyclobacteriaceae bacterium]